MKKVIVYENATPRTKLVVCRINGDMVEKKVEAGERLRLPAHFEFKHVKSIDLE